MIALGSDHAGFDLKEAVIEYLKSENIEYRDYGCFDRSSTDYAIYAEAACNGIISGECDKGILCCGTGIGMSMAANKIHGIRAAACSDYFSAMATRLHNDANVLCLGERVVGKGLAIELVKVFLNTQFEGGRHARRVAQIMALENK
ncbi:MAG: ribose 5-phosphate isomerase B [Oscillospiraceae bacterium]|nr:ribose 5-phosphate isomerase B [Oscillospiraceae bacterium]